METHNGFIGGIKHIEKPIMGLTISSRGGTYRTWIGYFKLFLQRNSTPRKVIGPQKLWWKKPIEYLKIVSG